MPKMYACCWLDKLVDEADIVHCIPRNNYRVTRCGETTGILELYLTAKELCQINDKLCPECFGSSKSKIIKEKLKKQEV